MSDRYDRAFAIIGARNIWETKQRLFYQMRHDGLRRQNKPFPTAADLHFPLIDQHIGDLKPFWMAQMYGGSRLTDFVAMRQQLADMTEAAADFFDFTCRYKTELRYRAEQMIDTMLLRGRGVLYAITNPFKKHRIEIRNIDPQYILMAEQFDDFEDADYWVWVQHLTVEQYKRNQNFNQDATVIQRIRGNDKSHDNIIKLEREVREGVTHSHRDDDIILWHHFERQPSGVLECYTYSPQAVDVEIRKPFQVPYEIDGEPSCPFTSFTMEIKDEGWYSPRGISELNAAFETFATKCWNDESDFMTFGNKPLFTSDNPMDNSANLNFIPGSFIPGNVRAVVMPQPPISFGEKINFVRSLSEQRSRVPDFGQFAPDQAGNHPITATQSRITAGLQSVAADHNGDTFREVRLVKFYRHLWALMLHAAECQKNEGGKPTLTYFTADNLQELPVQALHEEYIVLPAGGSANKAERMQRAGARFQLLKGAQNVDQDGIVKDLLTADDSRLVKRLLIPTNQKQATEAYQEDVEIGVMMMGRPVPVLPGQDHGTRITELLQFLHSRDVLHQNGAQEPNPLAVNVIKQHLAQHFAYLQQQQPQAAKQLKAMIAQAERGQQQAQSPPPAGSPQQPPPNGAPAPNGHPNGAVRESVSINYKDAPEDIKRQMERLAGFQPSQMETQP